MAIALSLAAPAFNEAAGIESVVCDWSATLSGVQASFELVICNDGSQDETGQVLERLQRDIPQLGVIDRKTNRGYGSAMNCAIAACRGEWIATIDSDGQFAAADVVDMVRLANDRQCDAVFGYRVRKCDSWLRRRADRALNWIVRVLFGAPFRDTNCALKVIRRSTLQRLVLEATGFAFPTEVAIKLHASGARIVEYPVRHGDRTAGQSKLRVWRVGLQTLAFLLYLRWRQALYRAGLLQQF
jgi:glycosyltransferase involved in cell wall biosynthesis